MKSRTLVSIAPLILLVACSPEGMPSAGATPPAAGVARIADPAVLARGAKLYQENCAGCHGARGEGAFAWQKPGPDGKYPAPPLDGSAHAWHHPQAALKQTIKEGTQRLGGSMPAWKGKLADADIEAVIAWFQSTWPDEIYRTWVDIDRRARAGGPAH